MNCIEISMNFSMHCKLFILSMLQKYSLFFLITVSRLKIKHMKISLITKDLRPEGAMEGMREFAEVLGGMPSPALATLVILAGFALAAYAIHAVASTSRKGRK